jgi:hypothetical protein
MAEATALPQWVIFAKVRKGRRLVTASSARPSTPWAQQKKGVHGRPKLDAKTGAQSTPCSCGLDAISAKLSPLGVAMPRSGCMPLCTDASETSRPADRFAIMALEALAT